MVTVILPALNEQASIRALLEGILNVTEPSYQIVVVDDGSTDGTAAIVEAFAGRGVRLVRHNQNRGLHEAMRTGLLEGLVRSDPADVIVTMDADNTHDPSLIPTMLERLDQGFDVVIASRFAPGGRMVGAPLPRHVYSIGARAVLALRFRVPRVRDYTCGYRAYRAGRLQQAFDRWGAEFLDVPGFTCMLDILLRLHALDAKITEVPLVLRYDLKESPSKLRVLRTVRSTMSLVLARLRQ